MAIHADLWHVKNGELREQQWIRDIQNMWTTVSRGHVNNSKSCWFKAYEDSNAESCDNQYKETIQDMWTTVNRGHLGHSNSSESRWLKACEEQWLIAIVVIVMARFSLGH